MTVQIYSYDITLSAVKASLMSIIIWLFLTHLTIIVDEALINTSPAWSITSLLLPHSGLLYGLIAMASRKDFGKQTKTRKRLS